MGWTLNYIALEIENPFGRDDNDLDGAALQSEMNRLLLLLVSPSAKWIPKLSNVAVMDYASLRNDTVEDVYVSEGDASITASSTWAKRSFSQLWNDIGPTNERSSQRSTISESVTSESQLADEVDLKSPSIELCCSDPAVSE